MLTFEEVKIGNTYKINGDKPLGSQLHHEERVKAVEYAETLFENDEPCIRVKSVEEGALDVLWTVRSEDLDEIEETQDDVGSAS